MKPTIRTMGTLISKRDATTNEILYQLSVNTSDSVVHFVFQVKKDIYNVSLHNAVISKQ